MPVRITASLHIFMAVVLIGTMWRIIAYHLMASQSTTAVHIGAAMATQY